MIETKKILVTGAAGFIGFHLCQKLITNGNELIGIDNLNNYYDINLKEDRINQLNLIASKKKNNWKFVKCDLKDKYSLEDIFDKFSPNIVINLAAQAGVRASLENPRAYIENNL